MRTEAYSATQRYIEKTFVHESALLARVRARGEQLNPGMQVSPLEGQWLKMLVMMIGATHILEVGTFLGYSALWMAEALPSGGTITTIEGSTHQASLALSHFAASDYPERFILKQGMALTILKDMQRAPIQQKVDIVFIDASKCDYASYLELTEPMLREGGLMVADNTLLFGHMAGHASKAASQKAINSMRDFNAAMADNSRFESILLPSEEGLTIGIKKTSYTAMNLS